VLDGVSRPPGSISMEHRPTQSTAYGLGPQGVQNGEESEVFSPASSRRLGRHLDTAAMTHSFSVPRRPVVATFGGPLAKVMGKTESQLFGKDP
jgi:hypothetical protein